MEQETKIGLSLQYVLWRFFKVGLPNETCRVFTVCVTGRVSEPCRYINVCAYVCVVSLPLPADDAGTDNGYQMSPQLPQLPPATPAEQSANYLQLVDHPSNSAAVEPEQETDDSPQAQGYLQLVG